MYDWRKKEFMQDKVTDYLNRKPVDISQDPAFQQYRDQYLKMGQQINADTARMVDQYAGGYDNTYAQNVGKQAYQKYVAQLNNIAPSFQSAAAAIHKGQGDQMLQKLSLAQNIWDREHQPVAQYRTQYNPILSDMDVEPGQRTTYQKLKNMGLEANEAERAIRYIQGVQKPDENGYVAEKWMLDESEWLASGDENHFDYVDYVRDRLKWIEKYILAQEE